MGIDPVEKDNRHKEKEIPDYSQEIGSNSHKIATGLPFSSRVEVWMENLP
jgi:hypothetical protein